MKHSTIIAFLLLSPVCFAQQVEIATTISPEDLGAYKWIFSGTAQEKSVVIFRVNTVREWPNGKVTTRIYDTVHYWPGKKQTGTAFFIDPHYFEPKEEGPKWCYSVLGGAGWIEGRYAGHSHGSNKGEIEFKSEKLGKTKKIFETFIKSYDDAVLLYDGLPPISPDGGWSWAGSPKEQAQVQERSAIQSNDPLDRNPWPCCGVVLPVVDATSRRSPSFRGISSLNRGLINVPRL